jgi:hypothetical protein
VAGQDDDEQRDHREDHGDRERDAQSPGGISARLADARPYAGRKGCLSTHTLTMRLPTACQQRHQHLVAVPFVHSMQVRVITPSSTHGRWPYPGRAPARGLVASAGSTVWPGPIRRRLGAYEMRGPSSRPGW